MDVIQQVTISVFVHSTEQYSTNKDENLTDTDTMIASACSQTTTLIQTDRQSL